MRIGDVFRYSRPYSDVPAAIEGFRNYFYVTGGAQPKLALLEKGINPIGQVKSKDGARCPAILIASSPHKIGSETTPWQDFFDPDNGHIRYYGDNKTPGCDPATTPGNKALLTAYEQHNSPLCEVRRNATPLIFFRRVSRNGRAKGFVEFQGFGIVRAVQRITQYDRTTKSPFVNYAFDFTVLNLLDENEEFDWAWVTSRRNSELTLDETNKLAPRSWREWISGGPKAADRYRRRVSKLQVITPGAQKPSMGSVEAKVLQEIYKFYSGRKARFEALAEVVAARVLSNQGSEYRLGWITPRSGDGGADFIGRFDIGVGLSSAKLIVLGQAKCESLTLPTNGRDIARTVARLRRGWLGVYVTTSYFSAAVQSEVIEDEYPIVLIGGGRLAEEVLRMVYEQGYPDVQALLDDVNNGYEGRIQIRRPEEILFQ